MSSKSSETTQKWVIKMPLEEFAGYLITGLTVFIASYLMMELQKRSIMRYLRSQDGMVTIASIGKLFGAGVLSGTGLKQKGGQIDIMGFKIPREWVEGIIGQVLPSILGKAAEKGQDLLTQSN